MKSIIVALMLSATQSIKVRDVHPSSLVEEKDVDAMLLSMDL